MTDDIGIRITLSSLLVNEDKTDEAVALLCAPKSSEFKSANTPDQQKPWWCDGKVKMQLAKIYYNTGKLEEFVDTIFLPILETLNVEHHNRKLCRTLALLQRYREALQIINHTLKLGNDGLSAENKEELRSLGAQITYIAPDPSQGFKYVRYVVGQHPYSLSAWNSFYKVTSR
ncbi:hypothetical protein PR202_ga31602 [Eleusine coracana subsp. coracana]|uniref:Uncharacterized protein n=1 Tax=Eleusine coracana subsp. coracana TaxID=191504 RepID=A0AAV5DS46_ELECO|nr:hypothetical protein PR202_ga31602 [Eleusine coracana subsp. coracana]